MEDKLNQAHLEVQQLKASVKNYEGMIDNYKSQVVRYVAWSPVWQLTVSPFRWEGQVLTKSLHCGFVS